MIFFQEKLHKIGELRRFWLRLMADFYNYSTAASEAIIIMSMCSEMFLKTALILTNSLAFNLKIMLKLNAFLRLALTGELLPPKSLDQSGGSGQSARLSSEKTVWNSSLSLVWDEGRRAVPWLKSVLVVLRVLPTICRHSLCVSVTILALVHMALLVPSAVCRLLGPFLSTATASWAFTRPLRTIFEILGGYNLWSI